MSLHKWLLAPLGTGILFVKRDVIDKIWPLQAAPATSDTNIRKYEEIGTAPAAVKAAIADALAFHQGIGADRKAARLYYLTTRWANALRPNPRIRLHSSFKPGETWGVGAVGIDGMEPAKITSFLWDKYRIIVAGLAGGQLPAQRYDWTGIRVTPNVYTTVNEIDTFIGAMQELLKS